jgi:hypothetical protein
MSGSSWRTLTQSETCPVCDHTGWCRTSPDGAIIACRRKESAHKREYSDGSEAWLHYLGEPDPSLVGEAQERKPLTPEEIERRDSVYVALIELLGLSDQHRADLKARGLTDASIDAGQYASLPYTPNDFRLGRLLSSFDARTLALTPGFEITEKQTASSEKYAKAVVALTHASGLLIPVRNVDGKIVALKVRRDRGEPRYVYLSRADNGSGSHVHVPVLRTTTVRVTEGELKADVATLLTGELTLSLPGVNSWRAALPVLEALRPTVVCLAFDADKADNKHVARAEQNLANALLEAGYMVEIETWPADHKGIDDALAAGATIEREPAGHTANIDEGDPAVALINFVRETFDLGMNNGEPHISPRTGSRRALALSDVGDYLASEFFLARGYAPKREHVTAAISVLRGLAAKFGERWSLPLRAGRSDDGAVVFDIGERDSADAIVLRPTGWSIERSPLVWRNSTLRPLPKPVPGGSIEELRTVINVTDETWPLVVGWLVAAMIPNIPHPIAYLVGPQGSAKTTTSRFLTMLIDPSDADSRSQVKDPADWAALGVGAYAVNLDNVSAIQPWFSDALCRAVTGDAYTPRQFYTQDQVKVLKFKLAMVMSTIDVGSIRGDLADRMLPIALQPISDAQRTTETDVLTRFNEMRPRVYHALLDLVVKVLAELPNVKLDSMPRMSDFATVLAALDTVAGFNSLPLYLQTRDDLAAQVVEGDPIAMFVRDLVYDKQGRPKDVWEGTLQDLLELVQRHVQTGDLVLKYAVTSERGISGALERSAPALAKEGVIVTKKRREISKSSQSKRTFVTIAPALEPAEPTIIRLAAPDEEY